METTGLLKGETGHGGAAMEVGDFLQRLAALDDAARERVLAVMRAIVEVEERFGEQGAALSLRRKRR
jgi:hypothetical protein